MRVLLKQRIAAACIGIALLLGSACADAAAQVVAMWKADDIVASNVETAWLRPSEDGAPYATVRRAHVARLSDTLARLQAQAGIATELYIVQLSSHAPNAFAKVTDDGRNIVGITPEMLSLLGEDYDAYAAVLGHEVAHVVKEHGATRSARRGFLQGLGFIAGLLIGAKIGFNPAGLLDVPASVLDRTFSRSEEREADRAGFEYMVAAGFDPAGAVRAHEKLLEARGCGSTTAFLATHPGGEERVASFRRMIASLPAKKAPPVTLSGADAAGASPLAAENP